MNYRRNRTLWKPGSIVIHDCDAKRPDMLMRVVGYMPDGRCRTEYIAPALRRKWGSGLKSKLINRIASLHGAKRFGLTRTPR